MPPSFTLDLTTPNPPTTRVVLRLRNEHDVFVDTHEHALTTPLPDPTTLLGPKLLGALAAGIHQRTLLVRVPKPALSPRAADLARVPWELARAPGDPLTLLDRNVVVRIALTDAPSSSAHDPSIAHSASARATRPIRVLLVFAESPGTHPLAARLERERLRDLFFDEIFMKHDVELDVLAHGVTRATLVDQIRDRGGYDILHWSGHGHDDGLEIAGDDGAAGPRISGAEIVSVFAGSGGFVPELVILSACSSGSAPAALALLGAGVKQIVAMRGEVGDTYARRLARRFYRRLLADRAHHPAGAALSMARGELAKDTERAADYRAADHHMPVVFGEAEVRFQPRARRSAQVDRRHPKPQPLPPDLDRPEAFVGRRAALATLGRAFIPHDEAPVAVVLGHAGIGKTHLAAEAVLLWFDRFDYVLCFPASGDALRIEDVLQQIHNRLSNASPAYRDRCEDNSFAAVYVPPSSALKGDAWYELLRNNLVDVLSAERLLLVIDGFEGSLLSMSAERGGHGAKDDAWDRLLSALADRLKGTSSRVIVTSRVAPAALLGAGSVLVPLGLLSHADAVAFLDADPVLRTLRRGGDPADLLARLAKASHGHPFVLARFAAIARNNELRDGTLSAAGRVLLKDALARLEAEGLDALPAILADPRGELIARGLVDLLTKERTAPGRKSP